jgi:hypothetical protein
MEMDSTGDTDTGDTAMTAAYADQFGTRVTPSDTVTTNVFKGYIRQAIANWSREHRTASVTDYQEDGVFGLILSAPDTDDAEGPVTIGMPTQAQVDAFAEQHRVGEIWIAERSDGSPVVVWQVEGESDTATYQPSILR